MRGRDAACRVRTDASRRGIALPAVLAAVVTLGLLGGLALADAVLESRVSALATDRVVARAALGSALDGLASPPDLAALCAAPVLRPQRAEGAADVDGRYRIVWTHLGDGAVRALVTGEGRMGARQRAIALLRPDSTVRVSGFLRCDSATRLMPAGAGWLQVHPEG